MVCQGMYNPITRIVEDECIPACRHFGLKFLAYNPLAAGLLTGKHGDVGRAPNKGRFSGEYYRERYWTPKHFEAMTLLKKAAERRRIPLAEASLRWLIHHSMADGLLIGASKIQHLESNLGAIGNRRLSKELCKVFDEAWQVTRGICPRYFRADDAVPPGGRK